MLVHMGTRELEFGGYELGELRDSNDLLGDGEALRSRMAEDGYLLIRELHDRDTVLRARRAVLALLQSAGMLQPSTDPMLGIMNPNFSGERLDLENHPALVADESVREILEGPKIVGFFTELIGRPVLTYNFKWLRAVARKEFTGVHYDVVYMGRGSRNVHTCWTPFGDIPIEQGTLAICVGSHRLPGFERLRQTYGRHDVDRDGIAGGGWFTKDPLEITAKFGGQWQTTTFGAGDVIVFGMYTLHASTNNMTDRYRISCDTRFQPADEPVDERWAGQKPPGHETLGKSDDATISLEEAKSRWGV